MIELDDEASKFLTSSGASELLAPGMLPNNNKNKNNEKKKNGR